MTSFCFTKYVRNANFLLSNRFSFNFLNFLFIDLINLFLFFNFNVKLWASFSVKYLLNNFKLLIITILGFILVLEFKFSLTFFFLEVQG
mgnify:FL=1